MKDKNAVLIWGNQLSIKYNSALETDKAAPVILIEANSACSKYKYHKQKITFVLTAMREFADALKKQGRTVIYRKLDESSENWYQELLTVCKQHQISELLVMRQSDKNPQNRLEKWAKQNKISLQTTENTLFLTRSVDFEDWAKQQKQLKMETFYRWQRQRLDILMHNGKPLGGQWNYDTENRKPLPKSMAIPSIAMPKPSKHRLEVLKLVETYFKDNPGNNDINWLPVNHDQATQWLEDFIKNRFANFGNYEDAMHKDEVFLFHSALSPLLNIGLLHPSEVIKTALRADVELASKEGFIRQIIGWREFMFGLYHYYPSSWKESNYFNNTLGLQKEWWTLDSDKFDEIPLKHVIARLNDYGYSHHIERLMVLGNYMLLSEYNPRDVYEWFMSMYVDAYEWVMVPNVIGMSQYADGGIDNQGFATKPYISGANYLQKMGKWWTTEELATTKWTDLYWKFLSKHKQKLSTNYRLLPLLNNKKLKK